MSLILIGNGEVSVDGEARTVDLSTLDSQISLVRFSTVSGLGMVEYAQNWSQNYSIGRAAFDRLFARYVQAWKAAGTPPARSLEAVKLDKRAQINSIRDNLEQAGFPYMDTVIDSNPVSVQRITVAVQAAQAALGSGQAFAIDWITQDNGILSLDAYGMLGMPVALALFAKALHENARDKKALIDAAETIDGVEAVTWA